MTNPKLLTLIKNYDADSFDTCPTWQELLNQLQMLTPEQLSNPVTIELNLTEECIPGHLDITGENHDSLDEDISVIRIDW